MTIENDAVYVATESFVSQDGMSYVKDTTRISGALLKKNKWEHLFKPLEVHFDVEQATKAPGEKRQSAKAATK
jgi:hypothetical protein